MGITVVKKDDGFQLCFGKDVTTPVERLLTKSKGDNKVILEACEAMVDSPIRKIVVEMGQMLGSIRQLQLLKLQQALLDWSRQLKELI